MTEYSACSVPIAARAAISPADGARTATSPKLNRNRWNRTDGRRKVWPYGGGKAVRDGYKDVYTHKLESIHGADIHFWYGSKEAFVAKPQAEHLLSLCPDAHIAVFPKMNHGQLLIDHPDEVARRISRNFATYINAYYG